MNRAATEEHPSLPGGDANPLEEQLMSRLDGKVAVITGGSSGIGLATARRFIQEGAYVFITGRRQSELDKAKALIGDGVTTIAVDSTSATDLDELFATVLVEKGALDILVVNSGRQEKEELGKITEENFDATFDLNARASLFTVQKALPLMRAGGSVILVGSVAGYVGIRGNSTYSATKAALRSYVRTWTREFGDRGIRFNALSPGPVDTPMMGSQVDSAKEAAAIKAQFAAAVPLNRLGRPDEIAAAALFLASDDSSFVAGAELSVDGGLAQV
jgi:NAD(P)-dependent dehydrogenase (short-subunit alcohol dehydrogenase family)